LETYLRSLSLTNKYNAAEVRSTTLNIDIIYILDLI